MQTENISTIMSSSVNRTSRSTRSKNYSSTYNTNTSRAQTSRSNNKSSKYRKQIWCFYCDATIEDINNCVQNQFLNKENDLWAELVELASALVPYSLAIYIYCNGTHHHTKVTNKLLNGVTVIGGCSFDTFRSRNMIDKLILYNTLSLFSECFFQTPCCTLWQTSYMLNEVPFDKQYNLLYNLHPLRNVITSCAEILPSSLSNILRAKMIDSGPVKISGISTNNLEKIDLPNIDFSLLYADDYDCEESINIIQTLSKVMGKINVAIVANDTYTEWNEQITELGLSNITVYSSKNLLIVVKIIYNSTYILHLPQEKEVSIRRCLIPLMAGKLLITNNNLLLNSSKLKNYVIVPQEKKDKWENLAYKLDRMSATEIDSYRTGANAFANSNNWSKIAKRWISCLN